MKSRAFVNHPVAVDGSAFSSVANVRCCPLMELSSCVAIVASSRKLRLVR